MSAPKNKYHIAGKGLNAIASLFEVIGNPVSYHSIHIRLGAAIFGEDNPAVAAASRKLEERKGKTRGA